MKKKYINYLLLMLFLSTPLTVLAKVKKVSCGESTSNYIQNMPAKLPSLTSKAFLILEVAIPVIIIIFGMIDLVKAITSGKDDEMKSAQRTLIKRLLTGAIVFFIFAVVKLLVRVVDENSNGIINCMDCFINNKCSYVKK